MSMQQPPGPTNQPPQRKTRDLLSHLVVPTVVVVVGAVLVTALTPLGENLRELLFPTRAVVTAHVTVGGHDAADATVTVDDADAVITKVDGSFTVATVGAGMHVLHVDAFGAVPADRSFVVTPGSAVVELGSIDLQTVVRLGFYVSLTPQTSSPKLDYEITLWVEGDEQTLSGIKKVMYSLPDPLPAKPVKGKKGTTFYCYSKAGTVKINDLFGPGGSFTAAQAEVAFSDGTLELTSLPGGNRPPGECPQPKDAEGSGSDSGDRKKSGGSGSTSGNRESERTGGGQSGGTGAGGGTDDPTKDDGDQDQPESPDPVLISCAPAVGGDTYQEGPSVSAQPGQEVRWVNDAQETMSLDIANDPPGWDASATDQVAPGATYRFTFTEAGAHGYTCTYPSHKINGDLVVTKG